MFFTAYFVKDYSNRYGNFYEISKILRVVAAMEREVLLASRINIVH